MKGSAKKIGFSLFNLCAKSFNQNKKWLIEIKSNICFDFKVDSQ